MSKLTLPFNGDSSQNEVPTLPRFVSDTIVDPQADQNLDEKGRVCPHSQPTKNFIKKDSTCRAVCEVLIIINFFGVIYGVFFLILIYQTLKSLSCHDIYNFYGDYSE